MFLKQCRAPATRSLSDEWEKRNLSGGLHTADHSTGRRGFSCTHLNSLLKVDEAVNVASQLDDFLGLRSTVLHHAQPGLLICELERKAGHGDLVLQLGCYVL